MQLPPKNSQQLSPKPSSSPTQKPSRCANALAKARGGFRSKCLVKRGRGIWRGLLSLLIRRCVNTLSLRISLHLHDT